MNNFTGNTYTNDNSATNLSEFGPGNSSVRAIPGTSMAIPLYLYILVSVLNGIIFVGGLFGNVMVVLVIIRIRDMRTPTNYFLLSLSVADIFVLLICQPAALMDFFDKDRWFIGAVMCKIIPLMENRMLHVSILTMLAVTAERYNAICHPFKLRLTCTKSTAIRSIGSIWTIGYLLTMPFLMMTQEENDLFCDGSPIKVCRTRIDENWRFCYAIFVFVVLFAAPVLILTAMYARIIHNLTSHKLASLTRTDSSVVPPLRARKQVVRLLIFIIVLFFVSLCPIRVVTLWLIFTPPTEVMKIGLEGYLNLISFARIMMYINSAGNPVIYSLTSTKFKLAFYRVLRSYGTGPSFNSTRQSFIRRSFSKRHGHACTCKLVIPLHERKQNSSWSQGSF